MESGITTHVARHYAIRMAVLGVVCIVFGLWGTYDLFVKIPAEEARADRFDAVNSRLDELQRTRADRGALSDAEVAEAEELERELQSYDGTPDRPSRFDRLVQILAMSCLLGAPYFFWVLSRSRRTVYQLEPDGTLVLPDGEKWPQASIHDLDMSRWMSKSVAVVIHADGRRLKLDDYVHAGVDKIVGRLAARLHPGRWTEDARRIDPGSDAAKPS